jgi:hypothetical protein
MILDELALIEEVRNSFAREDIYPLAAPMTLTSSGSPPIVSL